MAGAASILPILEEYKGDALIKNIENKSALDICMEKKNKDTVQYFLSVKKYEKLMT